MAKLPKKTISLIVILFIFDKLIKEIVLKKIGIGNTFVIIKNYLQIYPVFNKGTVFGLFSTHPWFLFVISTVVLFFITVIILSQQIKNKQLNFAFILLYVGILSNITDKIIYGKVIDFIHLSFFKTYFDCEFPVFNISDLFILVGLILLWIRIDRIFSQQTNN